MSLPKFAAPKKSIEIDGEIVLIRSLTRLETSQAQRIASAGGDWSELEIFVIACGTDTSVEETREWYGKTPNHVPAEISTAIKELSRLDEEAQKSGGESDSPGGG